MICTGAAFNTPDKLTSPVRPRPKRWCEERNDLETQPPICQLNKDVKPTSSNRWINLYSIIKCACSTPTTHSMHLTTMSGWAKYQLIRVFFLHNSGGEKMKILSFLSFSLITLFGLAPFLSFFSIPSYRY